MCVCVCVCVCGGGGIPRDSPQISPGNCSTMSLRIREQPRPLLGSLRNRGGIARLCASAFLQCVAQAPTVCVCVCVCAVQYGGLNVS